MNHLEQNPTYTPRTPEQLEQDSIDARRYQQRKAILKHLERSTLEEARNAHCKVEVDMTDGEFILLSPKKKNGIRVDMYSLDTTDNRTWLVQFVYDSYLEI